MSDMASFVAATLCDKAMSDLLEENANFLKEKLRQSHLVTMHYRSDQEELLYMHTVLLMM
jgi:hypothetical protein